MSANILVAIRTALFSPEKVSAADLREMQQACAMAFRPQRCPYCHARLFDGWLFGKVKCWRCQEMYTGYADEFLKALDNPHG